MAVAYETQSVVSLDNVTQSAPTKPSGSVAGDVLLGCVMKDAPAAVSGAGWGSSIASVNVGSFPTGNLSIFARVLNSSENSTTTFPLSWSGAAYGVGALVRISGADTTPVDDADAGTSTQDTTHTAPASSASVGNVLVVRIYGSTTATSWTWPGSGPTERFDQAGNTACAMMLATAIQVASGSVASQSATSQFFAHGVGITVVLKPLVVASMVQDVGMVPIA